MRWKNYDYGSFLSKLGSLMVDDDDDNCPVPDWRKPAPARWLDRNPWAQFVLFGLFVLFIALPTYSTFPKAWAFAGSLLVVVIIIGLGLPWPHGKENDRP
jgi:hypothetical protein